MVCHILVIEDDPFIACDIADAAMDAGATSVDSAASPTEALLSALSHRPDLILSDVQIIEGSGPAAVEAIREQVGDLVPVIFITGTPEACGSVTHAAILVKPVTTRNVTDAILATGILPMRRDG